MERSITSLKLSSDYQPLPETHESSTCENCGEKFEQPLFAVVSSSALVEEYYACPRCLSKVGDVERPKTDVEVAEVEKEQTLETEVKIEVNKMEESVACSHYVGYLKKRAKNEPIPEECLTCSKMIECVSY